MVKVIGRAVAAMVVVASGFIAVPSIAGANGPCGQNFDGNTACPLSFPATVPGSLVTSNESDYYVLHAAAGTQLFVTVTDTEDPTCSSSFTISCGDVQATLYDAQGNGTGESTNLSSPNNNITVPASFSHTIDTAGTYYVVVSGDLGRDSSSNPASVPYTLNVSVSGSGCGDAFNGNTACPLSSPANRPGRLVTDNESDYLVFHAQRGTQLHATVTDTEDPTCSSSFTISCGDVQATLYDAQGNGTGESTNLSSPNNNITVPASFATTIASTGTYYLVVSGDLGRDPNRNPSAVAYALNVTASPSVFWPPPQPKPAPCVVPKLKGDSLSKARKAITHAHCQIGQVTRPKHKPHRRHHHFRLVAASSSPKSGSTRPAGSRIAVRLRWI